MDAYGVTIMCSIKQMEQYVNYPQIIDSKVSHFDPTTRIISTQR